MRTPICKTDKSRFMRHKFYRNVPIKRQHDNGNVRVHWRHEYASTCQRCGAPK